MNPPPEAPHIFTAQPLAEGAEIELEERAARHVAGALRLRAGAALRLFNGQGGEYAARILSTERRRVTVAISDFVPLERESPLAITLGLGISRGERMDYALQKSTELGVASVVPLVTERTEVRLKAERQNRKYQHWQQVLISACEQCGRNRVPTLAGPTPLADWLAAASGERRLVLHHRADAALPRQPAPASVDVLVGPEGGLSSTEIDSALAAGFEAMRLGPRVLRTETAPVTALSILQYHWGDIQ